MAVWFAPAPAAENVLETPPRYARALSRAATTLLAASLALAVVVAFGAAAGYRGTVILSGSMEPAVSKGDLVVVRTMPAADLRPGQIVSFRSPQGVPIVHRVATVEPRADGRLAVATKGDANNAPERWATSPEATVGRVTATLPGVGSITRWTGSETGRLLVLGLIGTAFCALGLRRIWSG